ncbi:MAG: hypothetical protein GVY22_12775 [Gammaproteobacteria bacterium]|jgi:hypothetical protein|nr:hypothetical protein [Gammaproteobacteria bacterium]
MDAVEQVDRQKQNHEVKARKQPVVHPPSYGQLRDKSPQPQCLEHQQQQHAAEGSNEHQQLLLFDQQRHERMRAADGCC